MQAFINSMIHILANSLLRIASSSFIINNTAIIRNENFSPFSLNSGLVLAKPIGNHRGNLLNTLLAFQQEEDDNGNQNLMKFVKQQDNGGEDENDEVVIAQDEGGDDLVGKQEDEGDDDLLGVQEDEGDDDLVGEQEDEGGDTFEQEDEEDEDGARKQDGNDDDDEDQAAWIQQLIFAATP
jgi:hypothetical protein